MSALLQINRIIAPMKNAWRLASNYLYYRSKGINHQHALATARNTL